MNENQKELAELTMQLNLKVKEYETLCKELELYNAHDLNPNSLKYQELKQAFDFNYNEIKMINDRIKKISKL